jgi:hypothetical protein
MTCSFGVPLFWDGQRTVQRWSIWNLCARHQAQWVCPGAAALLRSTVPCWSSLRMRSRQLWRRQKQSRSRVPGCSSSSTCLQVTGSQRTTLRLPVACATCRTSPTLTPHSVRSSQLQQRRAFAPGVLPQAETNAITPGKHSTNTARGQSPHPDWHCTHSSVCFSTTGATCCTGYLAATVGVRSCQLSDCPQHSVGSRHALRCTIPPHRDSQYPCIEHLGRLSHCSMRCCIPHRAACMRCMRCCILRRAACTALLSRSAPFCAQAEG